jgi:hypothetical protein
MLDRALARIGIAAGNRLNIHRFLRPTSSRCSSVDSTATATELGLVIDELKFCLQEGDKQLGEAGLWRGKRQKAEPVYVHECVSHAFQEPASFRKWPLHGKPTFAQLKFMCPDEAAQHVVSASAFQVHARDIKASHGLSTVAHQDYVIGTLHQHLDMIAVAVLMRASHKQPLVI